MHLILSHHQNLSSDAKENEDSYFKDKMSKNSSNHPIYDQLTD